MRLFFCQLWLCSIFPWSTLIFWAFCLLSTILLSIIMYSEEMSVAFQCVYNTCPPGIQPLFPLLRGPAAIFNIKKKLMSFPESPSNTVPRDFKVNVCDSSTLSILTMWDHCKHEKDALCTNYWKWMWMWKHVKFKAQKLRKILQLSYLITFRHSLIFLKSRC